MNTSKTRWFKKLCLFAIQNRVQVVLFYALFTALSGYWVATQLGVHTNTQDMISADLDWRQDYIQFKKLFPLNQENILILIEGKTPGSTYTASKLLYQKLKQDTLFKYVFSYPLSDFFQNNQLLYASKEQLQTTLNNAPFLTPLASINEHELGKFLNTIAMQLDNSQSLFAKESFLETLTTSIQANLDKKSHFIRWDSLLFEPNPQSLYYVIQVNPNMDYQTLSPGAAAIEHIRKAFIDLQLTDIYDVELKLTGDIVLNLEELESVDAGAKFTGIAAFIMVAGLLLISFRNIGLVCISLSTLVIGLILTAAFATLAIGHLNMISVAFAVLYIGLSIDFSIHLIMHLKSNGRFRKHSLLHTFSHLGGALAFCAVSTACAFYAFIPTDFKGISELGLIAGTGMFISFVLNMTLLPALLSWLKQSPAPSAVEHSKSFVERYPRIISFSFFVLIVLSVLQLPHIQFEASPMALKSPEQPSVNHYYRLEKLTDQRNQAIQVLKETTADSSWFEQTKALPQVKQVVSLDSFVPTNQAQKMAIIEQIKQRIPQPGSSDKPEPLAFQQQALEQLSQRLKQLSHPSPTHIKLWQKIDAFIENMNEQPEIIKKLHYQALSHTSLLGLGYHIRQIQSAHLSKTFTQENLPNDLQALWSQPPYQRFEVLAHQDMRNLKHQSEFVEAIQSLEPRATGLPVIHRHAGQTIVDAFFQAFSIALCAVIILTLIVLRSVKSLLFMLVPLLSACVFTGALSVWLDLPFNFANIIALPLLLGMGLDNGIHLIHRYRSDPQMPLLRTSTSKAVVISTLTTVFSFANLSFSAHQGMSSMGQMLALGMTLTFLSTLLFLPALLSWLYGKK